MLNLFRKSGVAQIVVGGVAVTIIVVFALEFRPGRGAVGRLTENCAVKVYGHCIDQKEYFAAYGLIVPYGTSPKIIKQLALRKQILDGLSERELLIKEAERLGMGVSESAVEDELAEGRFRISLPVAARTLSRSLIACKVDAMTNECEPGSEMLRYVPEVKSVESGEFDYKKYERIIRNMANRGPREFKEMQQRELVAARMRNLVQARVRISVEEARLQFERERSKATVRTVLVNRDWFARYVAQLKDAARSSWEFTNKQAVDAAWTAEKAQFTADCPLVSEISLRLASDASDAEKASVEGKLASAQKRLKGGASFESVARQVSDAPSAMSGGFIGCLNDTYGEGAAELLQSLSKLKPDEVSPVVTSSRGLHILKFHGKLKQAEIDTLGRQAVAKRLYVRASADELAKAFAKNLIEKLKSGVKLEQAARELAEEALTKAGADAAGRDAAFADELRPKVDISAPFSMSSNPVPDALPSEALASKAFALEKPDAVHPEPITSERGYVVLQLKDKELAKAEQFVKERAQIMSALEHAKASDALVRYVAQLRKAAGAKVTYDQRLLEEPTGKEQDDS
jgi:peptidyl-prolyl cis-trans isomerase D